MIGRSLDWIFAQDRTFLLAQAHGRLERRLEHHGYIVEVIPGHVDYQSVEGTDRTQYGYYVSPDCFDRTPNNFLTLRLIDEEGKLRAMQSARYEALGDLSLEEFHQVQLNRLHSKKLSKGKPAKYQLCPAGKEITGNAVYHGDLVVSPSPRLPKGVLETFCVLTQINSLMKWNQDYSWCYLREKHERSSVAKRYSMFHGYPNAILWEVIPDIHFANDWIGFNTRSDIEYLAKVTLLNDRQDSNVPVDTSYPLGSEPE